jgi:hypothetical protein
MTTTSSEWEKAPEPTAPGYGDQGPAGAGRDAETEEKTAEAEDKPQPGGQD